MSEEQKRIKQTNEAIYAMQAHLSGIGEIFQAVIAYHVEAESILVRLLDWADGNAIINDAARAKMADMGPEGRELLEFEQLLDRARSLTGRQAEKKRKYEPL
jgi:hypothetical protein